jgi:hypothetical protein
LLQQLFADALFLHRHTNFCQAKQVIDVYARISGAKLDLSMSLILPLRAGPTPNWFTDIGVSGWKTRKGSLIPRFFLRHQCFYDNGIGGLTGKSLEEATKL